ncbi:Helix-turn-helix domain-containing protein [Lampropedia hyalina DSM 16112]|jgi:DNA-binding XRE family transcriptional regulator|uniref:Helix-turn-helix domain-containing protein n=1 Tax=Lampropedia hyalina DSM 16112 TaxID=1122156 RepID=A0A1M5BAP4_9BURK|nr:helix-turn-helix domain-containing protein [Lampropedia hyalina]SHF39510.1 Helix-turn-helix domain-containing protein [Lampropedia hyalina DSM 16112]
MDKRYKALSLPEQLLLRKQAIDDVLAHPEWTLPQSVRHLKRTMRLTSAELAGMAGIAQKTLLDIEQGRSSGNVQTLNKLLGVLGLQLGVVRKSARN